MGRVWSLFSKHSQPSGGKGSKQLSATQNNKCFNRDVY